MPGPGFQPCSPSIHNIGDVLPCTSALGAQATSEQLLQPLARSTSTVLLQMLLQALAKRSRGLLHTLQRVTPALPEHTREAVQPYTDPNNDQDARSSDLCLANQLWASNTVSKHTIQTLKCAEQLAAAVLNPPLPPSVHPCAKSEAGHAPVPIHPTTLFLLHPMELGSPQPGISSPCPAQVFDIIIFLQVVIKTKT